MSRLIETIRLYNGRFNNLEYHERRMHRAMKEIFGIDREVGLGVMLEACSVPATGLYKCRVVYNNKTHHVEFTQYVARPVLSLRIIHDDALNYDYKFEDRKEIERNFEKREGCDDVLMIKKGKVMDTSVANVVFRRGAHWITPASFLLPGTMRQSLLDRKLIAEEEINVGQLRGFESFKVVNAMVMFDARESSIENIIL